MNIEREFKAFKKSFIIAEGKNAGLLTRDFLTKSFDTKIGVVKFYGYDHHINTSLNGTPVARGRVKKMLK